MSFSNDVKKELCSNSTTDVNLLRAELYAMLLLSRSFTSEKIVFKTENTYTSKRFVSLISMLFSPILDRIEPKTTELRKSRTYIITVVDSRDCEKIYEFFGHDKKDISLRVNRAFVDSEDEMRAFLRGVFLSCGSVSDPEKDYHMEMTVPKKNLAFDIVHIIRETPDSMINVKMIARNGGYMIYLKDSEMITDFLTYIGSMNGAMNIMGAKALKDVRNKANRKANSEFANIQKTADASVIQQKAIRKIYNSGNKNLLTDQLKQIADIRLENPELSLREIGEMCTPKLTRSGVNHRMEKIIRISKEL